MPGIFPDPVVGGVTVRDAEGVCLAPVNVQNAYCPPVAFVSSCEITALPSDCSARITPAQINAIVSELLCLAETMDPNGPWNCNTLCNLATAFETWAAGQGFVDGVTIVGAGTEEDPWRVSADGVVATICADGDAKVTLADCLISTDANNRLRPGTTDQGLYVPPVSDADIINAPVASNATIDAGHILTLTSGNNTLNAAAQASFVVTSIVWAGDPTIVRPRNVVVRNSSTQGVEFILSNNLRAHDLGTGPARIYLPPLGLLVVHSFAPGFWILSTHLPSSALAMQVMARDAYVRDYLTDPGVPDEIDWGNAWQACHDDLRNTGGNMVFSEPHIVGKPVFITGYVGARGTAYAVTHRFGIPEPRIGAVVMGRAGLNLGLPSDYPAIFPNPPWDAQYNVPLGFFNILLDPNITVPASGGRPRVNSMWENFGIIGEGMAIGHGIRNMGTMYQNVRNMSFAWCPNGSMRFSGRADITQPTGPGSANGCRVEDVLITTCGSQSGYGIYWGAPDSHLENIQIGDCYGHQVYWTAGNSSGEQIESWNAKGHGGLGLEGENLYVAGASWSKISGSFYDSRGSNIVIAGSSHDIDLDFQAFRPNAGGFGSGDVRNTSNVWMDATVEHIKLSGLGDGGNQGHYGLVQLGPLVNLTVDDVRMFQHVTDDYSTESRNIFGAWGGRRRVNFVAATPVNIFTATSDDAIWEVMITRLGVNNDAVAARVIGGATPLFLNKQITVGSTVDMAIVGGVLQATCSANATGLLSYYRVR